MTPSSLPTTASASMRPSAPTARCAPPNAGRRRSSRPTCRAWTCSNRRSSHRASASPARRPALPATRPCPASARFDVAMLAYLGKRGIEVELRGAAHCGACEHGKRGAPLLAAHIAARDALEDASEEQTWAALAVSATSRRSAHPGLPRRPPPVVPPSARQGCGRSGEGRNAAAARTAGARQGHTPRAVAGAGNARVATDRRSPRSDRALHSSDGCRPGRRPP